MNNTTIEIKINGKITKENPIIIIYPNESNYSYLKKNNITFEELYYKMIKEWYPKLCANSRIQYDIAYKRLDSIHNYKISDLKTVELQNLINPYLSTKGLKKRMKIILNKVFEYGEKYDYVNKNYAKYIDLGKDTEPAKRKTYTDEEIKKLWKLKKYNYVKIVLIMLYTGMRLGEIRTIKKENIFIEESYLIGGIKTKTGKNRIIPICNKIKPLIKSLMKEESNYLINTNLEQNQFNVWLRRNMKKLNFDHKSHDARHTFASKMRDVGVNFEITATIMGHKCNNLLIDTYTHINRKILIDAVNRLK